MLLLMLMSVVDCLVLINVIALRFTFVVLLLFYCLRSCLLPKKKNAIFILQAESGSGQRMQFLRGQRPILLPLHLVTTNN